MAPRPSQTRKSDSKVRRVSGRPGISGRLRSSVAWSDAVSRLTDLEMTALDILDGMKADERWFGSGRRLLERGRRDPRRQEISRFVKEHAPDEAAARRKLEAIRERRNALLAKLGATPWRPVKRISVLCDRLADRGCSASEIMRLLEALGVELPADSVGEDGVEPTEAFRARVQRRIDRARQRRMPKRETARAASAGHARPVAATGASDAVTPSLVAGFGSGVSSGQGQAAFDKTPDAHDHRIHLGLREFREVSVVCLRSACHPRW